MGKGAKMRQKVRVGKENRPGAYPAGTLLKLVKTLEIVGINLGAVRQNQSLMNTTDAGPEDRVELGIDVTLC